MTDPRAGDEAARLVAAAQAWLRTSAPHLAPVADDGRPCSCPVCRAVAGLREADPDSVGRWVDTAVSTLGSLVAHAGDLAAQAGGGDGEPDDEADGADPADEDSAPAATVPEQAPDDDVPRKDGSSPRRVRRIPLQPQDDPGRQDR